MSTKENDLFLEEIQARFETALDEEDWEAIQPIYIELEEAGLGDKVIELDNMMNSDQRLAYKKWDRAVNGDIDAQMDDDS